MDVYRAQHAYWLKHGKPDYRIFPHSGFPPKLPPFNVRIPEDFLPWDDFQGVMAFPKSVRPNGLCRCGIIEKVLFFQVGDNRSIRVGLKIMDKNQIINQNDDAENEVRVMHQLQPAGLTNPRSNPHFLLWECRADQYNEYIATEYAEQGSLVYYIRSRFKYYKAEYIKHYVVKGEKRISFSAFQATMGLKMLIERLCIFADIIYGIAYMHSQNVCHLDLDPRNIVVDHESVVKIIDFGSSAIMDGRGFAGTGDSLIKFKPPYVAPEVRKNNLYSAPRPGFNGRAADMYAAGVILYQLLVWGYPGGDMALMLDPKWKYNLFQHVEHLHPKEGESCYLCYRKVEIPDFALSILGSLLDPEVGRRHDAVMVAKILQDNIEGLHQRRTAGPRARYG